MFVCCCSFASRFRLCFMPVQGNATVQERSFVTFQTQSGWRAVFWRASTSSSHEQATRASGRRWRLGRSIAALGDSTAHANPLKEALRVSQARASVPPVEERVESCKLFLERARKRVELLSTGLRNRKFCTRPRSMFFQLSLRR